MVLFPCSHIGPKTGSAAFWWIAIVWPSVSPMFLNRFCATYVIMHTSTCQLQRQGRCFRYTHGVDVCDSSKRTFVFQCYGLGQSQACDICG
jgi:hypothetical protein